MKPPRGGTARAVDQIILGFGEREFHSVEIFAFLPGMTPQAIRSHLNWLVANGRLSAYHRDTERTLTYRVQTRERGFYCTPELIDVMYKLAGACKRKEPKRAQPDDTRRRVAEILARVRAA